MKNMKRHNSAPGRGNTTGPTAPRDSHAAFLANEAQHLSGLFANGLISEAELHARKLLEQHSDWAPGWNIVGVCCAMLKRYDEAITAFRRVISLCPGDPNVYNNLGPVLQEQGLLNEAINSFQKALELKPDFAMAHMNLGIALRKQEQPLDAEKHFQRAIELSPDYADAHANLGSLCQDLGKMEKSRALLERAIQLNPAHVEALRDYTACRKFSSDDRPLVERLERLLAKAGTDQDRYSLHFALGKVLNDLGQYDDAFLHYHEGNRLERMNYTYDRRSISTYVDRLMQAFPAGSEQNKTLAGSPSELPVFIVGMPRSGTTLIEQILASHPLAYGAGELEFFYQRFNGLAGAQPHSYPECLESMTAAGLQTIADEYLAHLRSFSSSAVRITDKMPWNFLHLGLISLMFPKARVIHCRRDPLDTCVSIYFQRFTGRHPYCCNLGELGHYYREYERLMEHWRSVLPSGMMLDVQYEDLVEKPEEISRKLLAFCGLAWDDRCLHFHETQRAVSTPSSWQVRQPIYKTSKERWKRYEKHLVPLLEALSAGSTDVPVRHTQKTGSSLAGQFHDRGIILLKQGLPEDAVVNFRKALELQPDLTVAWYNLGCALQELGLLTEAMESYRSSLALKPDLPEALNNLGTAFLAQGKLNNASERFRQAIENRPDYADAHMNLGSVLKKQGKLLDAEASLQQSLALRPNSAEALNNIGSLYLELGRSGEAQRNLEKAIELEPAYVAAYLNYSRSRKFSLADLNLTKRLEELLARSSKEEDQSNLHFILGKIYSDCARYDEAFLHYQHGNQLERKKHAYNEGDFSGLVDRLQRTFSANLLRRGIGQGSSSELPIFILGMPRSGTTLIEQIISSHPLVCGGGELDFLHETSRRLAVAKEQPWPECAAMLTAKELLEIADEYVRYLRMLHSSADRITDKMPSNFQNIGLIAQLFPHAKVVHCRRDAMDTCLSIYFQKFMEVHPYAYDLSEIGRRYRDYERLMEHWNTVLPQGMMLDVQYEDVVEQPEVISRKLIEFCGLEWDDRCLKSHKNERAVQTASSWQVRQPIYTTSKARWKRYEQHLGPLKDALFGKQASP